MKQSSSHLAGDYRSLNAWLERFCRVAGQFRWSLLEGCKLRTKVDGSSLCPLLAYGYLKSAATKEDRVVPDTRNLSGAVGVHDSVASAVVHLADGFVTSRHWSEEKRRQLLEACKVEEEHEEAAEAASAD